MLDLFSRLFSSNDDLRQQLVVYGDGRTIGTRTGEILKPESALENATSFACINAIAQCVAQMPFKLQEQVAGEYRDTDGYPLGVLRRPNSYTTRYELIYAIVIDLLVYGNAYLMTTVGQGSIRGLVRIPPSDIIIESNGWGEPVYTRRYDGVEDAPIDINRLIHIKDVPVSTHSSVNRTNIVKDLIAVDNAITRHGADIFRNGLTNDRYISIPAEISPQERDLVITYLNEFIASGGLKSGGTPVLEGGVEIKTIEGVKPTDAEMLEFKRFVTARICGAYGVPASMIELDNNTANYNNVSQRYSAFYRDTISPMTKNIEQKMNAMFFNSEIAKIVFDASELLSGDVATKTTVTVQQFMNGIITQNEARQMLGYDTVEDGNTFFVKEYVDPDSIITSDRTYPDGEVVDIRLPIAYQSALNDTVPEGQNCKNCAYYESRQCDRWAGAIVRPDYWCAAYEPGEDV